MQQVNNVPPGGCIEEDGSAGDDKELGWVDVGVDGHVHMQFVPILLSWLRELAGLTAVYEHVVEANGLEESELPVDVADVDDWSVDELP